MHSPRRRRLGGPDPPVRRPVRRAGGPPEAGQAVSPGRGPISGGEKQFEITWSYYQQARTDSFQVYVWSRLVLDARREMGETPADRRSC